MPPVFPNRIGPPAAAMGLVALALSLILTFDKTGSGPKTSGLSGTLQPAPAQQPPEAFLKTWCFECHGEGAKKGGLNLDDLAPLNSDTWEKIRRHVVLRTMPPDNEPSPSSNGRRKFENDLLTWQASLPDPPPAHPDRSFAEAPAAGFRRLSRHECARSLESLLGISAASILTDFPEDETAHGFDNNSDMQPLPPPRLEAWMSAISKAVTAALLPAPVPVRTQRRTAAEFTGDGGLFPDAPEFHLTTSGKPVRVKFHILAAGRYRWSVVAYAHAAGDEPSMIALAGSPPQDIWRHDRDFPRTYSTVLNLPAGDCVLTYRLVNPLTNSQNPDPHRRMRRLLVRESSLTGPLEGDATPSGKFVRLFGAPPDSAAPMEEKLKAVEPVLTAFAERAWRRPLSLDESLRLLSLTGNSLANGLRWDESVTGTVNAILASPHFLFLADPAACPPTLRPQAVAARLSYFLWSRPDDGTLAQAVKTAIASPGGWDPHRLAALAAAMLNDSRAEAFAADFAGQWLQLRNAGLASPDKTLFPQATPELRAAMVQESSRLLLSLLRENRPVLELLTADHTFVNAALAEFYGLPFPAASADPDGFSRVDLPPGHRRGLLGQASVLMLTSYPNRTSPVLRGKYVLEALLGLEPPPPPPNVPTLEPGAPGKSPGPHTVRAALERHRADPGCASCHRAIDPLGFPLETLNAIGLPSADTVPPEPSTVFTGQTLTTPDDLTSWLVKVQGPRIVRHTAERLLTYALGRGLTAREKLAARDMADDAGGSDARFRDLLLKIVRSPAFRGEKETGS